MSNKFKKREYSQGIAQDGAAILCDGQPLTPEEIIARLRVLEDAREIVYALTELNMSGYSHEDAVTLNQGVCDVWSELEAAYEPI